jgi:hypothetical protein
LSEGPATLTNGATPNTIRPIRFKGDQNLGVFEMHARPISKKRLPAPADDKLLLSPKALLFAFINYILSLFIAR